MLFNSLVFIFLFLPVTYAVFWMLRTAQARYVWLTATGYVFYGYWDARFCLLMAFSTLVSYFAGLGFLHWQSARARKLCLVVPITIDLLLLGFFKYVNFLLEIVFDAAHLAGWTGRAPHLDIVLPVGISFYTFHTITYIVDCYRGVVTPTRNFFEFSCYVSLFSQLVAGPIVRFRQIEQDLANLGRADRSRWLTLGISFFLFGLVEKVLVADTLAAFVDPAWKDWQDLSTFGAWQAVLGYTFQLYFDFSGYSTMAVGLGYLFGIRIPQNFNSPYKALDPSDFWKRWHISLSSCLRDYLYIPLGGNRGGPLRTYRNLMLTMFLGGLWHGANWTFVIWGLYHGLLLVLHRLTAPAWDRLPVVLRQISFFLLVVIGWVFFRAENLTIAGHMLATMFVPTGGSVAIRSEWLTIVLLLAGWWAMVGPNAFDWHARFEARPRFAWAAAFTFGACVAIIMGGRNSPFLYFQF
ncbi:MAG: MBOAT family protein [Gemmataceae bacterium]|nr:MBOAT family protein [Gemmataceae bacterium]